MSARQKRWAVQQREELLKLFGGRCRVCGGFECLEFDCIQACGHRHHTYDTARRMSFYRRQAVLGNLQVLCRRCNAKKGAWEMETAFGELLCRMLQPLPEVEGNPF